MKILTLNTWQEKGPWRERWEIIFKGLKEYSPDVAAFQEVFNRDWAEEARTRAGYPVMVFFPEPSGLVLFSKYPVTRSGCLTCRTQAPTENYKRYVVFAETETPQGPLTFFNTHLSWKIPESGTRQAQVGEILDFISLKAGDLPAVVTGDFNAAAQTPEIAKMTQAGFADIFAALNPGSGDLTWDNRNPYAAAASARLPDRRIDYIFTRRMEPGWTPVSCRVVLNQPNEKGVFPSDHYGVLLEAAPGKR